MAANYEVLTTNRTVQVLGPTQIVDSVAIGFRTIPSEVFAVKVVPHSVFLAAGAGPLVDALAAGIEQALARPGVDGAVYIEDTDVNGLLAGFIQFALSVAPSGDQTGPLTSTVDVPVNAIAGRDESRALGASLIDRELQALQATASL